MKLPLDKYLNIEQRNSNFNFKYSAIGFQRSSDVKFRYRLANHSLTPWRETRLRELQINSLTANDYTFEVTAKIGNGEWNPEPSTYQFTVTPPFWRTLWFLALVIAATLATFFYRNLRSKLYAQQLENTVAERTKQLNDVNKGLEWLANHDNLTRLANRNFIHDKLEQLQESPTTEQLRILVIDLGYFKKINDKFGHTAGEIALKFFADMIQTTIKNDQITFRWGGEEFIILCPQIKAEELIKLTDSINNNCRNLEVLISKSQTIALNCSIWYAQTPILNKTSIDGLQWEKTIQLADLALYDAKHSGRDCAIGYLWNSSISNDWNLKKVLEQKEMALNEGVILKTQS